MSLVLPRLALSVALGGWRAGGVTRIGGVDAISRQFHCLAGFQVLLEEKRITASLTPIPRMPGVTPTYQSFYATRLLARLVSGGLRGIW